MQLGHYLAHFADFAMVVEAQPPTTHQKASEQEGAAQPTCQEGEQRASDTALFEKELATTKERADCLEYALGQE